MQTYEIEAYLGDFAWEYDIDAIQRDATDDMSAEAFSDLCEKHNLHVQAIKSINKAYLAGCYFMDDDKLADADAEFEKYENRLEYWSKRLGIDYNKLEDDCTDVRLHGYDAS